MLDYYIGQVGITPETFWFNSWKENQMLGEAYNIRQNLEWERLRYLATMIHNVNCSKKQHMVKPHDLFPLPQDKILRDGKPKSTAEGFQAFKEKAEAAGVKF